MPQRRQNKKMFKPTRRWTNAVNRVISKNTETKVKGLQQSETSVSSAAAAVIVNDISLVLQGDDDRQRIGDDIQAFGCLIKYMLINNSTTPSYTRVLLLQCEKDEFDAITDLILVDPDNEPVAPSAGNLLDINAGLNKRAINRVLHDKVYYLSGTDDAQGRINARFSKLFKFKHNVKYTTGSSSDNENHNLRLWFMTRDANADTLTVVTEFHMESKYYYKDP